MLHNALMQGLRLIPHSLISHLIVVYQQGWQNSARQCLMLLLIVASFPAVAWNAGGHRLVAAIAWEEMSPIARQRAGELLAAHIDHQRWLERGGSGDSARSLLLEAASWPDELRDDPRFYDEQREAATPPLPGLPDTARHRHWHYLDLPASGDSRPGNGDLDRQLRRLIEVLRHGSPQEKTYALPWIIHLLADLHQPLHVGSRNDEGGNHFFILDPGHGRPKESNLHRWWDDLPGPSWLRGARLQQIVDRLRADQVKPAHGDLRLWLEESRQLAHQFAYPATSNSSAAVISVEFAAQSQTIANQQIYAAGVRLGQLLDKLLVPVSRETVSKQSYARPPPYRRPASLPLPRRSPARLQGTRKLVQQCLPTSRPDRRWPSFPSIQGSQQPCFWRYRRGRSCRIAPHRTYLAGVARGHP